MRSSVIPASARKPFSIPIYHGQLGALGAPIIPATMVSAASAQGAPSQIAQHRVLPRIRLKCCTFTVCRGSCPHAGLCTELPSAVHNKVPTLAIVFQTLPSTSLFQKPPEMAEHG